MSSLLLKRDIKISGAIMSLSRALRSLDGTPTIINKVVDKLEEYRSFRKLQNYYYNIKGFKNNLKLFTRLAWSWRPWDSQYTIDVLIVLLKEHAHNLKTHSYHVGADKTYRRAMTASGLLDKAYRSDMDKSVSNLLGIMYRKDRAFQRSEKYRQNKEFYSKLFDTARLRSDKVEKQRKADAWGYVNKYIESIWD
jgi:hypothetical protein